MREIIVALIAESGLSLRKIADAMGVSPSAVGYWARGERSPGSEEAVKLASVLGVSVQYLLTGKDGHYLSQAEYKLNTLTGGEADSIIQNFDTIKAHDSKMFRKLSDDADKIASVYLRREKYNLSEG